MWCAISLKSIMKIISWNVNGIRAVLVKGFLDFVQKENPDILCIQETKAHPDQVDLVLNDYKHHYWNSAVKKGYSGTAVFSKIKPLNVCNNICISEHDTEGRVICLEFENFFFINVYVPNSGRGDFNVAHKEIDLANPKSNYN